MYEISSYRAAAAHKHWHVLTVFHDISTIDTPTSSQYYWKISKDYKNQVGSSGMRWRQFVRLPDYGFAELDRNRIRFTGIGPRVHQSDVPKRNHPTMNNSKNATKSGDEPRIWPLHCIDIEVECGKVLYHDLRSFINNESQCAKIKEFLRKVFLGLKRCNVENLVKKYCPLPEGHFDKVTFSVHYALDCYTSYNQIFTLIHHVLRSINRNRARREDVCGRLFGCDRNYRIFKCHIKWLVMGNAKLRKMNAAEFIKFPNNKNASMDLTKIGWLDGLSVKARNRVYIQVICAITKFILELLRRFFYITIGNPYSEMLIYFRYNLWAKIQITSLKHLIDDRVLCAVAQEGNLTDIPSLAASKLKFFLKKDGLRLICTKYKDNQSKNYDLTHAVLSHVLDKIPNYKRFTLNTLLEGLRRFRYKLADGESKVYFVRADIKDCFQSMEQDTLFSIVSKSLRSNIESNSILELFRWKCYLRKNGKAIVRSFVEPSTPEKNGKFELVVREENTKEFINIDKFESDYLKPLIMNPVLRESKTSKNFLNLMKGIRQGCKFSPALCSIYIQEAFNKHIEEFLNSEDCQVFHWVDDILFLSTDLKKAQTFMDKMLHGFKEYNLKMNLEKLACNFICPNLDERLCCLKDYVIFYKQRISLDTLQCSYNYSHQKIELQYTFKVSPYCDNNVVLEMVKRARMDLIHFDIELNGYDQVVENIFLKIALIAHRIATIFILSFRFKNIEDQKPKFLIQLIKEISTRVFRFMRAGCARKLISDQFTQLEIRVLAAAAFLVTWRRDKVKHRAIELEKLIKYFKRCQWKYLVLRPDSPRKYNSSIPATKRDFDFDLDVTKLMKKFSTSSFANEVILPSKN